MVSVEIPDSLYKRIESLAKYARVDVNEYIVEILREAVSKIEEEILSSHDVDEEEKKEIIERLKSLGYL